MWGIRNSEFSRVLLWGIRNSESSYVSLRLGLGLGFRNAKNCKRSQKIEHGSIFCDHDRRSVFPYDRRRSQNFLRSAIVCDHMETSLKPLGTPSTLIQILFDGNCLFRALSYAITGRQIYYTRVRAQIINHMRHIENFLLPIDINSSLDSYLANVQMDRNKVRVKGIKILSPASLLSTDIFVYTQFGDT